MSDIRPLPAFSAGSKLRVVHLAGSNGARSRLCALGLTPGTEVELVSVGRGPCRLKVRECDLVLGRGMAEKVMAVPASEYHAGMARCDCGCFGPR
ncbi:MAG TPA: ferrous iron transport protein A [Desulfonatronum sp.]|nr:ferrous iron transport protein A [Desulfonatronum sp.]